VADVSALTIAVLSLAAISALMTAQLPLPSFHSETAVVTSGAFARYPTPSGLMPCAEATLLYYDEVHVRL